MFRWMKKKKTTKKAKHDENHVVISKIYHYSLNEKRVVRVEVHSKMNEGNETEDNPF